MSIIKVCDLSYKTGNKMLLKNINWEVNEGENWLIWGLNGSGKTTILSIIAGLLPVEEGSVYLFDERLTKENRLDLCQKMGFVSESFYAKYYHAETANDVILAGYAGGLGINNNLSDEQIRYAKFLSRQLGLKNITRKPFYLLSKGERQKVLLVRAMLNKPKLLILDEPCSGLDVLARSQILQLFNDLARNQKISIICVTHHFDEILPIYNQALFLKNGQIHSKGNMDEVFNESNLGSFLGVKLNLHNGDYDVYQIETILEQRLKVEF